MIPSLHNKFYEDRSARLNLFSLGKRRLRRKFIVCFKILKGFTNVDANKLFSIDDSSRWRMNELKVRCTRQIELDCSKFVFTNDFVRIWNKLPPSVVQCITINSFKNNLNTISSSIVSDKGYTTRRTAGCFTTYASDYVYF